MSTATADITHYNVNGDVHGPKACEHELRRAAEALGVGQAGALRDLRAAITAAGVAGASPDLLAKLNDELMALGKKLHAHADEFRRQLDIQRKKIRDNPALAGTQGGGWLDPKLSA